MLRCLAHALGGAVLAILLAADLAERTPPPTQPTPPASRAKRVALVIGNGANQPEKPQRFPRADAPQRLADLPNAPGRPRQG